MNKPHWTVIHNTAPDGTPHMGRAWEFFDDEQAAQKRYDELSKNRLYPTKRPYFSGDPSTKYSDDFFLVDFGAYD